MSFSSENPPAVGQKVRIASRRGSDKDWVREGVECVVTSVDAHDWPVAVSAANGDTDRLRFSQIEPIAAPSVPPELLAFMQRTAKQNGEFHARDIAILHEVFGLDALYTFTPARPAVEAVEEQHDFEYSPAS